MDDWLECETQNFLIAAGSRSNSRTSRILLLRGSFYLLLHFLEVIFLELSCSLQCLRSESSPMCKKISNSTEKKF